MSDEKEADKSDLRKRTMAFAVRAIRLFSSLRRSGPAQVIGRQLLRSATSVGAHHREAYRARSNAEFISKMEVGIQELDETAYCLELLVASELIGREKLQPLMDEADELIRMFVASVRTAKTRQ